jgi:signal transduction histidine kinase
MIPERGTREERDPDDVVEMVRRFTHDVASPLTLVLALSELLMQQSRTGDPGHDDLAQIQASTREVLNMVRSLAARLPIRPGGPGAPHGLGEGDD